VGSLSCSVALILSWILRAFWFVLLAYAVVSWIPSLQGRWSSYLARIVEPVLQPIRRVIPPVGGLDIAFLIVLIVVGWASGALLRFSCGYYFVG
jgi:YggT family protein